MFMPRYSDTDAARYLLNAGARPLEGYKNANAKWKSKCAKCGKEIFPTLANILNGHAACVYCSGRKVHPEDAKKLMLKNELRPLVPYPGSTKKWKCIHIPCGKTVFPTYTSIVSGRKGCSDCGHLTVARKLMLDSKIPILDMKRAGFKPLVSYPGRNKPWKSKCLKCKTEVAPTYGSILRGTSCGVCSGRIVVIDNVLKMMESKKIRPISKFRGMNLPWKSECLTCGNVISPVPSQIKYRGDGCGFCSRKAVNKAEATTFVIHSGYTPLEKYPGSSVPWKVKCNSCREITYPTLGSLRAGHGCAYCERRKVSRREALDWARKSKIKPLEPYVNVASKWKAKCLTCGNTIFPTLSSIIQGHGACIYCSVGGLDFSMPAYLYLITNSKLGAHKIGIAGKSAKIDRVRVHKRDGWIVYKTKNYKTGSEAIKAEQKVLAWLFKEKKLSQHLSKSDMPQGGHTETVEASEIKLVTIWAKVEELSKVKK